MAAGLEKFQRCEGCPIVKKGQLCWTLSDRHGLVGEEMSKPDFVRLEFVCPDVRETGGEGIVSISREGAMYGMGMLTEVLKVIMG